MTTWKPVFSDKFPQGSDVDRSKWTSPSWTPVNNPAYYGRTGIRNPKDFTGQYHQLGLIPCTSQNGADLRLSTYNPLAQPAHGAFLGSELRTIATWGGSGQQVKFEAEVKCPTMRGGAVTSLFSYGIIVAPNHDEIDFEFASNHWATTSPARDLNTNVYVNSSGAGFGPGVKPTTVNFQNWNIFSLIWTPSKSVEWQINGKSFLIESQHVPTRSMHMVLNFWAPKSDWGWAFNAGLQPSGPPGEEWHYYVKSAAVSYGS
jgi:hypothetical protein